jgi:hypothetical protein
MPSHIAATLGPKPGNTLKPPPNNFYLTKWTPLNQRSQLLTESPKTAEFKFFSIEQVDQEPEVIAGIDLNEIITKPAEKVGVSAAGSPTKTAPASPNKVTVSFVGSTSKGVAAPSPQKVAGSASPPKPVSPQKPVAGAVSPPKPVCNSPTKPVSPQKHAQSPKDQVMQPASPLKQFSPRK